MLGLPSMEGPRKRSEATQSEDAFPDDMMILDSDFHYRDMQEN